MLYSLLWFLLIFPHRSPPHTRRKITSNHQEGKLNSFKASHQMAHNLLMTHIRSCLNARILKLLIVSVPYNLVYGATPKLHHFAKFSTFSPSPAIQRKDLSSISDAEVVAEKIRVMGVDNDILSSLMLDKTLKSINVNHSLVGTLLHCFKNDCKSALGIFRWAESPPCFKHLPESCDFMVDNLGKARQFDKMEELVAEMREKNLVSLETVTKMMRRYAGAGQWKDAVRTFEGLADFGLEKNSESMNWLLDILCEGKKVEMAYSIFLDLKSHIPPTVRTFNIFVRGWCKVKQVEKAYGTLEEMKKHGFPPSVISYSTIIQFYCRQSNWCNVFELLDVMEAQGCQPSSVLYTNIMCSLAKAGPLEYALKLADKMKSIGCEPDISFYNELIILLGKNRRLSEALDVFRIEMPKNSVTPNIVTYNTLITMFCRRGQVQMAFSIHKDMEKSGICKPDLRTFYPLLKACLKAGEINDGLLGKLLDDMVTKHRLSLDESTYSLLIHLLSKAGKCDWAFHLFEEMIGKDLTPRYEVCRYLLDKVKGNKGMHDAVRRIKLFLMQLNVSKKQTFPGDK